MGCPQCQSDEIGPTGVCLICGYRMTAELPQPESEVEEEKGVPSRSGPIEVDYSEGTAEAAEKTEVPPWRQQLSQRLHEIKQKKESMAPVQQESKTPPPAVSREKTAETLNALQARLKKIQARKPQAPPVLPPRQKTLQPLESEPSPKDATEPHQPQAEAQEIRNLIDSAVSKQVSQDGVTSGITQLSTFVPELSPDHEGKLILLSRTLSGLVDLIVVVFCTGAFFIAADYFSGIVTLDHVSLILFLVVFLLNYFVYSLFFLASSNQTIGMMITELRLVGMNERRPSVGQLMRRCCGYLASLFFAGIGLLSALFDEESLCFHDRISGTHVVRI